jgi:hypothetical protein
MRSDRKVRMKKRAVPAPIVVEPRLASVLYCVDDGLRKLVPTTHYGAPGYTKYGVANSCHDPHYEEGAQEHLVVTLCIWPRTDMKTGKRHYQCFVSITDGDDFILQRVREFTYENWCEQLDMYNSITQIDKNAVEYLMMEGFA